MAAATQFDWADFDGASRSTLLPLRRAAAAASASADAHAPAAPLVGLLELECPKRGGWLGSEVRHPVSAGSAAPVARGRPA